MLTASWLAAGWLVRRFAIAGGGEALGVGGLAFGLLMAAECALAVMLMGQTPAQWFDDLRQPHALLGLGETGAVCGDAVADQQDAGQSLPH